VNLSKGLGVSFYPLFFGVFIYSHPFSGANEQLFFHRKHDSAEAADNESMEVWV